MNEFREAIRNHKDGAILHLFVTSGANRTVFPAGYNIWRKRLDIKVRSEAKDNKANNEVVETIARFFKILPKNVILVSGQKSREKTVALKKVPVDTVCERLEESFHGL